MAQVDIQAGPFRIVSLMSREAVDELDLQVGSVAVAVIKSTTVVVEQAAPAAAGRGRTSREQTSRCRGRAGRVPLAGRAGRLRRRRRRRRPAARAPASTGTVTVFAAASLTESFTRSARTSRPPTRARR